jgi:polynucleotide 5'-hydroxyl-kinase GRC3/NOL9
MASFSSSPAGIFIPDEWSRVAKEIADDPNTSPPPIAFICGAKNSGKTTFSRHLLNILLQRYRKVACLDTDVGQSEFTPPGCLSLTLLDKKTEDLAIPCLKTPERCFFFGDISSRRDPAMYVKYIYALYDYYRQVYCNSDKKECSGNSGLPLVINTPGWVKGVGYDILVDLLKYISPTHVVNILISADSKNLPRGKFWLDGEESTKKNPWEINSARTDSFNRSVLVQKDSKLLRDLRMVAYFRQCFPSDMKFNENKDIARALASHPPYEVPISSITIKHLYDQVPAAELFYSLNATIVGLAVKSTESEDLPKCVGLGIVRAIDSLKEVLYVITPVPHSVLENVDLLLQGFIQIPSCLLQVQGCVSPYMSSNVLPEYEILDAEYL